MYRINDQLATHGLEEQWGSDITDDMIAKPDGNGVIDGFKVMDIRGRMLDARNPLGVYRKLTDEALGILRNNGKVVICCSAGVSRSNSIAIAVLVKHFQMNFDEALSLVSEKVLIANPLPCQIQQLSLPFDSQLNPLTLRMSFISLHTSLSI